MIRAVLVDDEPPARVRMRHLLNEAGGVSVVGEAGNADEARELVRDRRPDVLFLDIEMPEVRGTTLAASLPEPRPFIVFATAYEHYALDAIACDATDYLLKPVSRAKLASTLERIRVRLHHRSDTERDVATASAVQADMWPGSLPPIPGFDCAAASLPARGVGGDFYDAFALQDDTWGTAHRRRLGQGRSRGPGRDGRAGPRADGGPAREARADRPGRRVERRCLRLHAGPALRDDDLRHARRHGSPDQVVNAGHPGALLFPAADGEQVELTSTGPALGLMDVARFTSTEISVPPGSILVAFTDGVIEALDGSDVEFGVERVAALVNGLRHAPAATLCAALLDGVRRHRGARQDQDDVTVLVVKGTDR